MIGDAAVTVALALFMFDLTGDPTDLGLVLVARTVPLVGLLLIGGVWADRLPRHRLMVVTDVIRFALHALLAALIFTDAVEVWHVVVIEALFGAAQAFFQPAATGLTPQTVPEGEIQDANAMVTTAETVAELVGPALATAIVLGVGAAEAFALDAATFAFSAACLVGISPRSRGEGAEREAPGSSGVWSDLRDGFDEVRSRPWVWVTLLSFSVAVGFAFAPEMVVGPSVAEDQYGSTGIFGVLAAVFGAGSVAGALIAMRWTPRHPMRTGMLAIMLWPPAFAAFALGLPLPIVLVAAASAGVGFGCFEVWWMTALAQRIPPGSLSRVSSYDWMVSLGLLPVGYVAAGPLAEEFGASEVLAGGSAVAFLALAAGLLSRSVRDLETLSDPDPVPTQSGRDPTGVLPR